MTIEQIDERVGEINSRRAEIDKEYEGQAFPDEAREEWNKLLEERDEVLLPLKKELEIRNEEIVGNATSENGSTRESGDGADFQIHRASAVKGNDIYDLTTVRATGDSPLGQRDELRDRVLRFAEKENFPHPRIDSRNPGAPTREDVQAHIERIVGTCHELVPGPAARYILEHGSPL